MKKWKQLVVAFGLVAGVGSVALPAGTANAINVFDACSGAAESQVCAAKSTDDASKMSTTVVNTMLFILGILAVIMIIVSGIKYVTANGDASKIKSAKDTLTYSIVGLVVAILAYSIVNFVVTRIV